MMPIRATSLTLATGDAVIARWEMTSRASLAT